ncbi:MAG: penicillin-binding transpeptidase domain-containing protein [Candidatus Fermentibacteria bacterium]|nr:penicillin-binding transpeptidase domain-containing protein [Candidatus Fermentibacteria bacterium]
MRSFISFSEKPYRSMLIIITIVFLLLAGKLVELQILKGDYYRELSSRNHIRSVVLPAPRGIIRDRNGVVLADNQPAFTVSLVSAEFDPANTEFLGILLRMDPDEIGSRLAAADLNPYRSTQISSGLPVEEAGRIADNLYRLGGVSVNVLPRRRYPLSTSFCHLVGYVGLADSTRVFEGELSGRTGLERILNRRLSGEHGVIREVVDVDGRVVERFQGGDVEPEPGEDMELTLDSRIQLAADSLIAATGHPGAAVIINYRTGEILALSSVPGYDTGLFIGGISSESWNDIINDPGKPLLNRAWATAYPPGSTFKIVSAAWLLESGIVDENTMPDPCYGTFHFAGSDFKCWSTHGRLNITGALTQSCDTYFYRTSMLGDMDEMAEFAHGYGMGAPVTGILPGEDSGAVPTRELLNDLFGQGGWGLGNLMIASIGQGEVLATPLQIAVTAALIASGGELPPLTVLKNEPFSDATWERNTSGETYRIVREGMRLAVESNRGTLHSSMGSLPVQVFGKSGTAENGSNEDHAWVNGYIEEPIPIAFAVIIENGGHGGAVAGPVAAGIIMKILEISHEAE